MTNPPDFFPGMVREIRQEDEKTLVRKQLDTKSGNQQKSVQLKPDLLSTRNRIECPVNSGFSVQCTPDFALVSVDGGRASIPPPDWQTGKISMMDYKVAQIHDTLRSLDEYIRRSRLEVDTGT
jgi:hypothetical protein